MKKSLMLLALVCFIFSPINAQKKAFTIADLYHIQSVSGITVSPDGTRIAFVKSWADLSKGRSFSDVFVMNVDGTNIVNVTSNNISTNPFWGKDGKSIYYVSYASGSPQVYYHDMMTSVTRQLTDFSMGVGSLVLSPDNKLIAFTADVYPECGADSKANKETDSLATHGPLQAYMADHLLYRHWTEYSAGKCSHIIIYNIEKQTYSDVTPGQFVSPIFMLGGGVGFVFSPDSKELCYVSNHTDQPALNTNADLFTIPVEGGEAINITKNNEAWDGSPAYSPDGRYIAYRKQTLPCYESDCFRIALYDRKTGESITLSEKFDNWVDAIKWNKDSKSIYFTGQVQGCEPVYCVDIATKKISSVIEKKAVFDFDLDNKGNVYFLSSSTEKPTALYKQSIKKKAVTQLTFFNKELEETVDIRPSEIMWVNGADNHPIEVFIVKPHNFDANKKYPLVLNIHGGPQMQWMDSFRGDWQIYPGAGYVLAFPNPHGSTGYGQDFTRAISNDWGGKPYEDVMKITDALANLSYVDSTRIGVMGWSYGGYMMNWLQSQTKRYKCLASTMGIYDLRSMWGSTEEMWFPEFELKGRPWNSDLYKKFSPSEYVKNFATPTLIITGQLDFRVPYTQSLQYFSVLQTLGIPSRLIIFKNDGHWPSTVKSMPLYYDAHLDWFHKYLGGDPAPYDVDKMIKNQANLF